MGQDEKGNYKVVLQGGTPGSIGGNPAGTADTANPVKTGGRYNAVPPTLTDGQIGDTQLDSTGNTKVTLATTIAGEDIANDVMKVEERGTYFAINTATTTTVKTGAGYLYVARVIGGTLGAVTFYDNTAASGTTIVPTVTPSAAGVLVEKIVFGTGLTIVTASAMIITGSFR